MTNVVNNTVFENHRKSLIQHCERRELRLHFEWIKVNQKGQKLVDFGEFFKTRSLKKLFHFLIELKVVKLHFRSFDAQHFSGMSQTF